MRIHNLLLKPFGCELMRTGRMRRYREPVVHHLADLLRKRGVETVIDVGANVGQFAGKLRAYGYRGRILSFEPLPGCCETLVRASAGDGLWEVHNMALGAAEGEVEVNLTQASSFSSLRAPSEFGMRRFGEKALGLRERVKVPLRRLDGWLAEDGTVPADAPLFLKTDTQGFDLEVFRGAEGVHSRLAGVLAELPLQPIYEGVPDWMEMLAAYRAAGFEVVEFHTVSRDDDSTLAIEADCLMARPLPPKAPQP